MLRGFEPEQGGGKSYIFKVRFSRFLLSDMPYIFSTIRIIFPSQARPVTHKHPCRNQFIVIFGSGHAVHVEIAMAITNPEE